MSDVAAPADAAAAFQPAPEIVAELKASPLPREGKAAMAALSSELGPVWHYAWSPFRCLFGFTEWTGALAVFPDWPGVIVDGKPTHAFGPWQDEPETYREVVALTGNPGCAPQDQISNNWVLAVRDFGRKSGGADLLAALKAGRFDLVSAALAATWPAGADAGFGARYTAALALFAEAPPGPAGGSITLRPGMEATFPVVGTDQDGQPFLPPDALLSANPAVCTVGFRTKFPGTAVATIAALAVGNTRVHGADLAIAVVVEPPRLVHLSADLTKAVISRIPTAVAALLALGLLAGPPGVPRDTAMDPVYAAAASANPPSDRSVRSTRPMDREPKQIGDPDFCFASGSLLAMERCLRWTAVLSRH